MKLRSLACIVAVVLAVLFSSSAEARGDRTEAFVQDLYQRFAYRSASPQEVEYWRPRIEDLDPSEAESQLRNWFFVHAAYKTTLGRTVTIQQVRGLVEKLDRGQIQFHSVQRALFQSPEYQEAKRNGRAGTLMIPRYRPRS